MGRTGGGGGGGQNQGQTGYTWVRVGGVAKDTGGGIRGRGGGHAEAAVAAGQRRIEGADAPGARRCCRLARGRSPFITAWGASRLPSAGSTAAQSPPPAGAEEGCGRMESSGGACSRAAHVTYAAASPCAARRSLAAGPPRARPLQRLLPGRVPPITLNPLAPLQPATHAAPLACR